MLVAAILPYAYSSPTQESVHLGSFDPKGIWKVKFSGDALARSFYLHDERNPHVGSTFSAVAYFGHDPKDLDFLLSLDHVNQIQVKYLPHLNEIQLTGGAVGTRVLKEDLSSLRISGHKLFESTTPLASQVKMVAPGCLEYTGITERVSFSDSDTLDFYDRTVFLKYVAPSQDFGDCEPYLNKIRADIRNGIASNFWIASSQSNGIEEDRIESLVEMDIHFIYSAVS